VRDPGNYYTLYVDGTNSTVSLMSVANGAVTVLASTVLVIPPGALTLEVRFAQNVLAAEIDGVKLEALLPAGVQHVGGVGIGATFSPDSGADGYYFDNVVIVSMATGCNESDCSCWGGPPPQTVSDRFGSCDTICQGFSTGWDAIRQDSSDQQFTGIVGAGLCDDARNFHAPEGSTGIFPIIASDDDYENHGDRDFQFRIVPQDGLYLGNANRWGGNAFEGAYPGDINVETESMYMYPTIDSYKWANQIAPFNFGFYPSGMPFTTDGSRLGIPWSGDQMVIRGRMVWDCGHCSAGYNRAEVHPPTALAWLHPVASRNGMVWLRAFSHRPHPGDQAVGSLVTSQFAAVLDVPGGPNGQDLYVGPVKSDFLVDTAAQGTFAYKYGSQTDHPWGCITNQDGVCAPSSVLNAEVTEGYQASFAVSATGNTSAATTTVTIQATRDTPLDQIPYIMGAHYQVCYPECDANGNVTNGCPGTCRCTSSSACPAYNTCDATGHCSFTGCDSTHLCNGGCCSNGGCTTGTSASACGSGGACTPCAAGQSCCGSACVASNTADTCCGCNCTNCSAQGDICRSGQCFTPPDCSSCACGCNANLTGCAPTARCSAAMCNKLNGYCDECLGCVTN